MSKKKTTKQQEFDVEKALNALENAKPKRQENTVFDFLKKNIGIIDAKQKEGMSLKEIYVVINNASPLNISQSSFAKYISVIRKETGSDLYSPRQPKKKKQGLPSESPVKKCERCGGELFPGKLKNGDKIFVCNKSCKAVFAENGEYLFTAEEN